MQDSTTERTLDMIAAIADAIGMFADTVSQSTIDEATGALADRIMEQMEKSGALSVTDKVPRKMMIATIISCLVFAEVLEVILKRAANKGPDKEIPDDLLFSTFIGAVSEISLPNMSPDERTKFGIAISEQIRLMNLQDAGGVQ